MATHENVIITLKTIVSLYHGLQYILLYCFAALCVVENTAVPESKQKDDHSGSHLHPDEVQGILSASVAVWKESPIMGLILHVAPLSANKSVFVMPGQLGSVLSSFISLLGLHRDTLAGSLAVLQ